jgi:alcohol dehydrogenase class IV
MLHALEVLALRVYMAIFKVVTALMPFKWPRMFEGTGSSLDLVRHMADAGHRNVLIVTDAVLVKLGVLEKMKAELETQGVKYVVYDGVEPNPTVEQIEAGYRMLMENGCQAILAVGGGSPIDAAKMIGARAKNNKPVLKLTGLFAVPTTAGTGAEVTIAAVVSDTENKRKVAAMDIRLLPTAAALDGSLMTGLPAHITSATGMDALTHAVEAFVSRNATRKTNEKALEATQLIMKHLETAVADGSNLEARQKMARASHLAGIAFTQAGVGYVHGIAHKFGALYHTPHGLANAIVMPHVLDYSLPNCADRLAILARACGIGDKGADDVHLARAFIARIREMNAKFGIPTQLAALKAADIPAVAKSAIAEARFTYAVPRYMNQRVAESVIKNLLPTQ